MTSYSIPHSIREVYLDFGEEVSQGFGFAACGFTRFFGLFGFKNGLHGSGKLLFFLKFFHAALGIQKSLLSGKKRMAFGAHINRDGYFGGACRKDVPTRTNYL